MRRVLFFVLFAVASALHAKNVGEMFMTVPDSIFPYLTSEQRSELLSLKRLDYSTPAVLNSIFNCEVALSDLDDDRMTIKIDTTVIIEIGRLYCVEGDSLFCLLRTAAAPEMETLAAIYNKEWQKVGDVDFDGIELVHRPDTMEAETFEKLMALVEFRMVEAHFGDGNTLVVQQNFPLTSREDKARLEAVIMQRKLKWDGERYKIH